MKRIVALSLSALALAACSDNSAVAPESNLSLDAQASRSSRDRREISVTNAKDAGTGSFRWAIEQANANPSIREIEFKERLGVIALKSSVVFTGAQDLSIDGERAIIDGAGAGGSAFVVTGGGDLEIEGLTVRNAPGQGIEVQIPTSATGIIDFKLEEVTIENNTGHGLLINDQEMTETTDGVQPNANGSAASLKVSLIESRFIGNGYSVSDRDGVRINEGGEGNITFTSRETISADNAADGIELDERGVGDVIIDVTDTRILRNGKFDPTDLDDGFDIDEYNDGSIIGTVVRTNAIDNYEEGLDFNENNAGDLRVDLTDVEASGNGEEGVDYEEDDDFAGGGHLVTTMLNLITNRNGGDGGLKIREKGVGDLTANVTNVEASNNKVSGIAVREDGAGNLLSAIVNAKTLNNTSHGVDFDENSTGDVAASIATITSTGNGGVGVRADQQLTGVGALQLAAATLTGNTGGTTTGANVTVTIVP